MKKNILWGSIMLLIGGIVLSGLYCLPQHAKQSVGADSQAKTHQKINELNSIAVSEDDLFGKTRQTAEQNNITSNHPDSNQLSSSYDSVRNKTLDVNMIGVAFDEEILAAFLVGLSNETSETKLAEAWRIAKNYQMPTRQIALEALASAYLDRHPETVVDFLTNRATSGHKVTENILENVKLSRSFQQRDFTDLSIKVDSKSLMNFSRDIIDDSVSAHGKSLFQQLFKLPDSQFKKTVVAAAINTESYGRLPVSEIKELIQTQQQSLQSDLIDAYASQNTFSDPSGDLNLDDIFYN